ncbi:MAG TPA: aminotransferase class I/II-fold pyridoxal phosphate-dependent enzyme [Acidimicrobiales bacterium]|nr:Cys/Met metabolism PLP-dependent enzyme [Actinomycetota bacterium]MDP6062564.1 aminotransferase class I/II-fold pyridoxal phosphate-dependent enzyme [Acidimicrobiales bacterium]MDP7208703.1 aminotransferase class I/II-fold pyridoxal phosphate-dependent enzyme [Acidimicrobiales bacterium]HJL89100.1 aminotransferase class I/II-fold pyridoxal phosphate-dependent enzyme [Acidimicrobiales bacterium]HJO99406.1 aminotransferase class I/II-fold pyridoxal phosphate-dependent enzyme [Acidimicrobiales 
MAEQDTSDRDRAPETMAIMAGRESNQGALAPILWATTAFAYDSVAQGHSLATGVAPERFYSRYGNPTINAFEATISELEGAEASRAFASGMGAMSAVVLGLCSTGDHIVAQRQIYAGTQLLLQTVCPRFGIDVTFVDGTQPGAFAEAIRPGKTMLVVAETPANPYLDLVDLDELGALVGPMTVVDSTFATPLGQQPIAHGVDLVVHSATKAIAGHNDASIGVVSGSEDLIAWLWSFAVLHGANASPSDALNAHRGLRTLGVRLARQSETAQRLAEFLEGHGSVSRVAYPGLESHPQHGLAQRQMNSMGGLLTFDLVGGSEAGERLVESTSVAILASTLGGPETLVTHPASTTHVGLTEEEQAATGIGQGTIRVSCGLEDSDDVVADFEGALAALS